MNLRTRRWRPHPPVSDLVVVGILGGGGLYAMEELRDVEEWCQRPWPTIGSAIRGSLDGTTGSGPPWANPAICLRVPGNIWAMRSLGVRWILSCSAVGSLQGTPTW